jgi:hypothetical protein
MSLEKRHLAKFRKGEGYICAEEVLDDVSLVREVDEIEDRKDEIFEGT